MMKRLTFLVLFSILFISGCSYFNPPDLNLLIDQSRGSISFTSLAISPSAMTTNTSQEVTISCAVESDFPMNTVTADLSSVGQGVVKLNPSADKKNWSIKVIVTPQALGTYSFDVTALNQKEKTVKGAVSLTMTILSLAAIYVSPAGDDGNPGNQAFPFKTLGYAVSYAKACGITNIYLAGGSYIEANTAYSCAVALVGLTNMLIQGGWNGDFTARSVLTTPSIIDGNHVQSTVVVIKYSTNLVMDGLALKNSKVDAALASIFTFLGGGLYAEKANFNFINGEISGNETVYGGGMYCLDITGIISNSSVISNIANNLYGGGYFHNSIVQILNTLFGYNDGIAVTFINCTNFIFQRNTLFSNYMNVSTSCAAVLISNSATIYPFYSNRIEKNRGDAVKYYRSDISSIVSNELLDNIGGMFFISNTYTSVLNNTVTNCSYGVSAQDSSFYFGNNTFIDVISYGMSLSGCYGMMVSNNYFSGIDAYTSYSPLNIFGSSNVTFMNNLIYNCNLSGYSDSYKSSGGIMVLSSTNISLLSNMIVSNYYSGHYEFGAGGIGLYKSIAQISNNLICWNGGEDGGGIMIYNSSYIIYGNMIDSNWASCSTFGGGGIYANSGSSGIIQNNSISYNTLYCFSSASLYKGGSAIHISTSDSILSNVIIENSTTGAYNYDAVIYVYSGKPNVMTNIIGSTNQSSIGLCTENSYIGKIDANIFVTNRMLYLYKNSSKYITNDIDWTNINNTNYTGAGSLTTPNTVTNL